MATDEDRAISKATAMGHDVKPDGPEAMTAAGRWTCACGSAVLVYEGNVYGSATTVRCPLEEGTPND